MSGFVGPILLAAAGSTGNNTHTGLQLTPTAKHVAFVFIVEAVGGGPTVTYKFQGTLDIPLVADGSANWTDIALLPAGSETVTAAPAAATGVGATIFYLAQAHSRFFRRVRLVTSANTNVTYRAELYQIHAN